MSLPVFPRFSDSSRGQALVEFALVIGVLLLLIFVIIDAGRLFQAWVTVQNSARSAGRYAITGEYDRTGSFATPECPVGVPVTRWQVCSIKNQAYEAASGLNIDPSAGPNQPRAFGTQVCQPDNCPPEGVGLPGEPTRVSVFYNADLVTPFLRPFAKYVRVIGQVEVVTEQYNQVAPGDIIIADVGSGVGGPAFPNEADLAILKEPAYSTGDVMKPVYYTLTVKNFGPFSTPSIEILDLLPSGTVSMTGYTITDGVTPIPSATCNLSLLDQQMSCTIPYLDGDPVTPGVAVINIGLLIAPPELDADPHPAAVDVTNTATVFNQIGTIDPNPANNVSSVTTTIRRWYDLKIAKTLAPGQVPPVNLGNTVDFVINVENIGPNTAYGAVVTDELPQELQFESIVSQSANANCSPSGINGIQCLPGPLAFGDTLDVRVQASVIEDRGSDPVNTATVSSSDSVDVDSTNNSSSAKAAIKSPDLRITKWVGPIIYTDEIAVYTVRVVNYGDGTASQVLLTDDMQPGPGVSFIYDLPATFESDTPCKVQLEDVVCQGFDIAPGEANAFTLHLPIIPELAGSQLQGKLNNTATASSNGGFEVANPVTVETPVERKYDLGVTKRSDLSKLESGFVSYTVEVSNYGPSDSLPFTLSDNMSVTPDGAVITAKVEAVDGTYIPTAGDCTVSSTSITCDVNSMPKGARASLTIGLDLTGFAGTIANTASVKDFALEDEHPNSASAQRVVYPYALEIKKSGPSDMTVDGSGEYVVEIINHGPLTASFSISDLVETQPPDLIGAFSLAPNGAVCNLSPSNSFVCDVTGLSPGASAFITAKVTPKTGGILTNTATILDANNVAGLYAESAFVRTIVQPVADLGVDVAVVKTNAISETFQFQFDVTDYGPATAASPRITNTLTVISGTVVAATMKVGSLLSANCDQVGAPSNTTVTLACDLPDLVAGGATSVFVEVVFAEATGVEFSSQVIVHSDIYDPGPAVNVQSLYWP
jgi:uncharacterized repeat protein (TIGR01451 family)